MKLPPRLALALRRTLVTAGVAGSILVGAVTVRAAAAWTASAAPMESPPVTASELSTRLSDAVARSAALDTQIADLTTRTADLAQALASADKRVGADSSTARSLRAQLAAAQKKLAALSKALKSSSTIPKGATAPTPAPTPTPARHGDDD
jgi:septal ring factor EnvC (AmiA/AmiB activator)